MTTVPERPTDVRTSRIFRGQPRWFGTLFGVDMWERFSFYGMTATLYLYLVADPATGGVGISPQTATSVFGLYMSLVFLAALPGGWIADRWVGAKRAVLVGGVLIAVGHGCLAIPSSGGVFAGLGFIIAGTGLLKPSLAAMVSASQPEHQERREAAFSFFYMSIQISALVAPLVTGYLGEKINWHLGFGIAAFGMVVGLVQYVLGYRGFGDVGEVPSNPAGHEERQRVLRRVGYVVGVIVVLVAIDVFAGSFDVQHLLIGAGLVCLLTPFVYNHLLLRRPEFVEADRSRIRAYRWLLVASASFWMLFSQSGSVLTQFAADSVQRTVLGFEVPASWFQSASPLFMLLLAPLAAVLWLRLGSSFGAPAKLGTGLLLGGGSFLVMAAAAAFALPGASPWWLLGAYLLLAAGEITLAPVGLALAAQVAPEGYTNRLLALYWLFAAFGVAVGGLVGRLADVLPLPVYFMVLGGIVLLIGAGVSARTAQLTGSLTRGVPAPTRD